MVHKKNFPIQVRTQFAVDELVRRALLTGHASHEDYYFLDGHTYAYSGKKKGDIKKAKYWKQVA